MHCGKMTPYIIFQSKVHMYLGVEMCRICFQVYE